MRLNEPSVPRDGTLLRCPRENQECEAHLIRPLQRATDIEVLMYLRGDAAMGFGWKLNHRTSNIEHRMRRQGVRVGIALRA